MIFAIFFLIFFLNIFPLIFSFLPIKNRSQIFFKWVNENILSINNSINDEKLIDKGFILSNHRSFLDFIFDPILSKSTPVGRYEAFLSVFGGSCLFYNRMVAFSRPNTLCSYLFGASDTKRLFKKILNHMEKKGEFCKRILIWPEGTRLSHTKLDGPDEVKKILKYGFLKRIYEHKVHPVQLLISSNKEKVINEKKLTINRNIKVNSMISSPIFPEDYNTFMDFTDKIAQEWYHCWLETHT